MELSKAAGASGQTPTDCEQICTGSNRIVFLRMSFFCCRNHASTDIFLSAPDWGWRAEGAAGQTGHKTGREGAAQGRADWTSGCCPRSLFLLYPNVPFYPQTLIWSLRGGGGQGCGAFAVPVGKTSQSGLR